MFPVLPELGIDIVLYFQNLGTWLTYPMKFFSFLGSENFFLLVAPALYWCIDASIGLRFGIYLSLSAGINSIFKIIFHSPRPYWIDRRVMAFSTETSFGVPSGHAQNASVVWGSLAASLRKKWVTITALILIFFIGLSRIYLGVHFAGDVLVGWLIGLALLLLFIRLEPGAIAYLKKLSLSRQIAMVFLISLLIIIIALLALTSLGDWSVPQEWIENAAAADPGADPIDPLSLAGIISNAAAFFGLASGALWLYQRGGFQARGVWWKLILRYGLGLVGVILIWFGLDQIFPGGEDIISYLLRYVRYALVGVWVSGFAPAIFIQLRLAEPKHI